MRVRFTLEECLIIFDQSPIVGELVRRDVLESAIAAPFQTFGGQDLFPTILEKAARLGFGIAEAQAFSDGNKRMAFYSMMAFLKRNGLDLQASQKETADQLLLIAEKTIDVKQFAKWLSARCNPADEGVPG